MRRVLVVAFAVVVLLVCPLNGFAASFVLSDFETDADLAQWEATGAIVHCPEGWCEPLPAALSRVSTHATSGSYSCEITMLPVDFPGMNLTSFATTDWSPYDVLRMDFFNPTASALTLHLELSDSVVGSAWSKRYYTEMVLIPGANQVELDLHNVPRNDGTGDVDTANVGRFLFYVTGFSEETAVYVDYVRLETVSDDPWADAASGIYKFDFGTDSSARWPDFFRVTASDDYAAVPGWGWTDSAYRENGDFVGPDSLCRDFVRPIPCCPTSDPIEFRVDVPNGDYTVYVIARSGELHGMPVLGWQISAEGALKVDVPMDSATFYSTDYYYRGMDADYPLGASFFEEYVETNYPAYTFTTTVSDGALDLSFWRPWVYMAIVYPTALEAEMGPRISALEADRQTQFDSAYYVTAPEDLTFTPTAEETARGYAAWPVVAMDPTYPDTVPPSPRPAVTLSTAASRGERRPVTFAIRPLAGITNVWVEASDLSDGEGHVIPSSQVDCEYVRYMATPDTEFFGSGVLTWKPRLLQSAWPIDVAAQVTKEFWLTITVPGAAAGGTYTGTITVHASSGDLSIPVSLEVWPFQLDPAEEMAYGWYYTPPEDRYCFNTLWFADKGDAADEMLRLDFAHMKERGYNSVQFPTPLLSSIDPVTGWPGGVNQAQRDRYVDAMRDTGFGGDWKGQVGTLSIARQILRNSAVSEFDANFDAAFKEAVGIMQSACEADGYELAMYLVDEPRETMIQPWNRNFVDTMEYCDLADLVSPPVTSTVTLMGDSNGGVDYTPIAENTDLIQTHPWPNSAGLISHALSAGKPIWFYNTGGDLRMVYGFYQYKWGDGCWEWHFDWLDEGFDAFPYSPFNNHWHYTYPSPEGPVSTLNYEWGSLGITDYRYAATLERLSEQARASGEADLIAWANQADALLLALKNDVPQYAVDNSYAAQHFAGIADGPGCLTEVEEALEGYRRQIAQLIQQYGQEIPAESCAVAGSDFPDSMAWNETAEVSASYLNVSAGVWQTGDGYALFSGDGSTRWRSEAVPLSADCEVGGVCSFDFDIVSPPWTSVRYGAVEGPMTPAEMDAFPCDWMLAKVGTPLDGGLLEHEIVVSRFPDDGPGTASEWARTYIEACAGRIPFIVEGYEDGSYRGEWQVNRAAMAVFIARAGDYEIGPVEAPPFPDVSEAFWAAGEIEACVAQGVVQGYGDGLYRPGTTITRDQMAVYIQRARGYGLTPPTEQPFLDVGVDSWAAAEIQACADHGVVEGYADGYYRPWRAVTRSQMAVFVYRAFVQPSASVVVLGGPGLTDVEPGAEVIYPGDAAFYGWPSVSTVSSEDPGTVYVALDAARMGPELAGAGTWDLTFTVRADASGEVEAEHTISLSSAEIEAAGQAVSDSGGCPYLVLAWDLPSLPGTATYTVEVDSTSGSLTGDAPILFEAGGSG